jgi:hypothetical protein
MKFRAESAKVLGFHKLRCILPLLVFSSLYVLILLFYTGGALLYGGDNAGYYSAYQALVDPTPNTAIFGLGMILAGGNYYLGFYLTLFVCSFLVSVGMFYFTKEIFEKFFVERQIILAGYVAALLYLFNPVSLSNTFQSFTSNVYITNSGFLVFLIGVVRLWKSMRTGIGFRTRDGLVMGIGLGLSSDVFPNNIRIMVIGGLILAYFVTLGVLFGASSLRFSQRIRVGLEGATLAVAGSLAGGLYILLPEFQNLSSFMSAASQGISNTPAIIYQGSFNQLPQVFRLLGLWSFSTDYAPYHDLYFSNTLVVAASFLWPLLAIGIPLLISERNHRGTIVALEVLVLSMLFWEKAGNPPFGQFYAFVISRLIVANALIPTYFLSTVVLSKLYPVLAAYSIVSVSIYFSHKVHSRRRSLQRLGSYVPFLFLLFLLLVAATPVFSGQVEGQYFNSSIKGFRVPVDYQVIKNYLLSHEAPALVFPATGTYLQTDWGYQGGNYFYKAYFAPTSIYCQDSFGGGYASHSALGLYEQLMLPLVAGQNSTRIPYNYSEITTYNSAINASHNKILLFPAIDSSPDHHVQLQFHMAYPLDVTGSAYIELKFATGNQTFLKNIADVGGFSIGVASGGAVGWYLVGTSSNSYLETYNNGTTIAYLMIASPDKPWTASFYDPSNVTDLIFQFPAGGIRITLTSPTVYVVKDFSVSTRWITMVKDYNIRYLIVDKSLIDGNVTSYGYVNRAVDIFQSTGLATSVYRGDSVTLMKLNFPVNPS